MKTKNEVKRKMVLGAAWLVFGVMTLTTAAVAGESAAPAAGARAGANAAQKAGVEPKEMASVDQFLKLTDAELDQLAKVIARIRAMTPQQRADLRREVDAFCCLPEKQRMQMRQGWGWATPETQEAWREMMQHCTEACRAEIHEKMSTLAGPEKAAYRKQLVEEYQKTKGAKK